MHLSRFFEHWSILENPFRGEEARQDSVFLRLESRAGLAAPIAEVPPPATDPGAGPSPDATPPPDQDADSSPRPPALRRSRPGHTVHSDFHKVAGDFDRPSTAIVFGEKGSGKTAMRLQLEERIAAYNARNPDRRCLLLAYDDLNSILDRFFEHARDGAKAGPDAVLSRLRLQDHIDGMLTVAVPLLVDSILGERAASTDPLDLGPDPRRAARKIETGVKRDLLLLQAVYDTAERAEDRTRKLRRRLRLAPPRAAAVWTTLSVIGWIPAAAVLWWSLTRESDTARGAGLLGFGILAGAWAVAVIKRFAVDRWLLSRIARRVRRQVRVSPRTEKSIAAAIGQLDPAWRSSEILPVTDSDQTRYAMLERLRRALSAFGYTSLVVVIDRVDEPTLISGDAERMRSVVWPLLNNKFLQQPGIGVKMLLPMELRHALFRESAAFFQEARLDKQNLIERLSWTGAMLYDLCNARLQACRPPDAEPITLLDLFEEDVTRQDLVDALDQMHQPRDAFKLLYQCFAEHCSNVTEDQAQWRVPRLVLESVRKDQAERVRQLYRGVRPA